MNKGVVLWVEGNQEVRRSHSSMAGERILENLIKLLVNLFLG